MCSPIKCIEVFGINVLVMIIKLYSLSLLAEVDTKVKKYSSSEHTMCTIMCQNKMRRIAGDRGRRKKEGGNQFVVRSQIAGLAPLHIFTSLAASEV
jgi:hypothetical protein